MAWVCIQYEFQKEMLDLDKFLVWLSANTRCYFAVKEFAYSEWIFFSGEADHTLDADFQLVERATEALAQTNYLTTTKDANGFQFMMLPAFEKARFVRIYIDDDYTAQIHEFNRESFRYVEDDPVDGHVMVPISSNWAYDHANAADPHSIIIGIVCNNNNVVCHGDEVVTV